MGKNQKDADKGDQGQKKRKMRQRKLLKEDQQKMKKICRNVYMWTVE